MTTNIERAVNIIMGTTICDFCEIIEDPDTACAYCERDAGIVAQALADAGILMPDLPEPYSQDESSTSWLLNGDVGVKVNPRCAVIIEHMDVGWFALPPEDASRFADMIKAAANHAEQEQDNV